MPSGGDQEVNQEWNQLIGIRLHPLERKAHMIVFFVYETLTLYILTSLSFQ